MQPTNLRESCSIIAARRFIYSRSERKSHSRFDPLTRYEEWYLLMRRALNIIEGRDMMDKLEYQIARYELFVNYARNIFFYFFIFFRWELIKESSFLSVRALLFISTMLLLSYVRGRNLLDVYWFGTLFAYRDVIVASDELKKWRFLELGSTDIATIDETINYPILDKRKLYFRQFLNYCDILYRWTRRVSLLCRNAIPLIDSHPVAVEWNFLRAREYVVDAFPSRLC